VYRIAKSDILAILDAFNMAQAETEKYDRIPYSDWRNLKSSNVWEVSITETGEATIHFYKNESYPPVSHADGFCYYDSSDRTLGRFLVCIEGWLKEMSKTYDDKVFTDYSSTIVDATKRIGEEYWYGLTNTCETLVSSINTNAISAADGSATIKINGDVILNGNLKIYEDKGDKKTMNLGLNLDFGNCKNDNIKLSPYGIAVKNTKMGTWVSYDPKGKKMIDVNTFVLDGTYLYKIPVAIKDVKIGDVILHNKVPVYVESVENGKLLVIDPVEGVEVKVLPLTNMFGFNFVTKVVSLIDVSGVAPTADSPFGNMLPLMMMSEGNIDPVMLMLMNGKNADFASNPMMLYFLMNDKGNKNDNLLPLLMLMNTNTTNNTK
jgi:hypothetical protein